MQSIKAYTAQKDLLSAVIIAEYGGYYFDCTTEFTAKANLEPIMDFKITLTSWCQEMTTGCSPFYGTDIWAFGSSEPGHSLFMACLDKALKEVRREEQEEIKDSATTIAGVLLDVLVEFYGDEAQLDKDWLLSHSWRVEERKEGKSGWSIKSMELDKLHTGLW